MKQLLPEQIHRPLRPASSDHFCFAFSHSTNFYASL
jgi:hypothetical protein